MIQQLNPYQLRVIGCLIEKSLTTPEHYPLSINSLTNACNQKSNREPVLELSEIEVQSLVDELMDKNLIITQAGSTSRVVKYRHRFCNTEFSDLRFTSQELGIICVLFLRGPQTPGELRTRSNRLCEFKNVQETEMALKQLVQADKGPFVVKLEREPGKRESRYAHCFGDKAETELNSLITDADNNETHTHNLDDQRLITLEEKVELMQLEIDELTQQLNLILKDE